LKSSGLKSYLIAAIYFEYIKNALQTSQAGVVNTLAETATNSTPAKTLRFAENKFNDCLDTVYAIQWYCINNNDKFPDFNGQRITVKANQFFI
jgi:hypothetical protein